MAKKAAKRQPAPRKPATPKPKPAPAAEATPAPAEQAPEQPAAKPEPTVTKYQKTKRVTLHRSELKGAAYNPRKINKNARARLKKSLKSHGYLGGILWNRRTGNIVGGHQRISQIDDLEEGCDYMIDVDEIDVSLEEEMEINIILNNTTAQGEWDADMLADVLVHLKDENRNIERTGFTSADAFMMLGDVMLEGEPAAQAESESESIDFIAEIKEAAKQAAQTDEDYEDVDLPSDTTGREPSLAVPTPKGADEPEVDPRSTPEALKARRKEYASEIADDEDADFMVTFCFRNNEERRLFQRKFGLQADLRYFHTNEIESAFNIELENE